MDMSTVQFVCHFLENAATSERKHIHHSLPIQLAKHEMTAEAVGEALCLQSRRDSLSWEEHK